LRSQVVAWRCNRLSRRLLRRCGCFVFRKSAMDSKTVEPFSGLPGFESLPLRHHSTSRAFGVGSLASPSSLTTRFRCSSWLRSPCSSPARGAAAVLSRLPRLPASTLWGQRRLPPVFRRRQSEERMRWRRQHPRPEVKSAIALRRDTSAGSGGPSDRRLGARDRTGRVEIAREMKACAGAAAQASRVAKWAAACLGAGGAAGLALDTDRHTASIVANPGMPARAGRSRTGRAEPPAFRSS